MCVCVCVCVCLFFFACICSSFSLSLCVCYYACARMCMPHMRTCMPHIRTCMHAYACVRACTHALHLCWVASLIEQKLHALRCGVSAHCRCRCLFLCLSLSLSLFLSHHAAWPFQQPSPLSQSAERPCRRCFALRDPTCRAETPTPRVRQLLPFREHTHTHTHTATSSATGGKYACLGGLHTGFFPLAQAPGSPRMWGM